MAPAKFMLLFVVVLIAVGFVIMRFGHGVMPFSHLPGDLTFSTGHGVVHFPLLTCVIISLLLTFILTLLGRFHHR